MQHIPAAMASYRQFVLYTVVPSAVRPNKTDKWCLHPVGGYRVGHNDPTIRMTAAEAQTALATCPNAVGIGFVITPDDPFFCIDVDEGMVDGAWSQVAQTICSAYDGCYVEVSLSGKGLHVIGTTPPFKHGEKNSLYKLDLYGYGKGHFIALTGFHARGDAAKPADLAPLLAWPGWSGATAASDPTAPPADWTTTPDPEWNGPTDDNILITRILCSRPSAASALSGKATVQDLWSANPEPLAATYPDNHADRSYDASAADAALCQHLAFWTGKDCARIERLFRQSALFRPDRHHLESYLRTTILKAVGQCRTVLGDRPTASTDPDAPTRDPITGELVGGSAAYCTISEQPTLFQGCCYIRDRHRVLVPDGDMLTPERFRVEYGGRKFMIDSTGNKTTKNAFECFTESEAIKFPQAHTACFRPEQPPGQIFLEEGRKVLNTYIPVETRRESGDPGKFLDLLRRMLPVDRDREILLTYMAALVQNPGVKFQWWPVIQGTEGNGKSAIIRCLAHAVGQRYTHLPNVDDMARNGAKFNSWITGKLFLGIEEIYVNDRRDFLEAFKAIVTNDRIQIEGKGADQVTGDNRCNGIMCTNHKDGVPVTTDQRRYTILYTAQQSKDDKLRDGMGGDYFPDLYDWFAGRGDYAHLGTNYGYAVVCDYLHRYECAAEFNPARRCQEAPRTSSTDEAVTLSLGSVEQEVNEAIASGQPGFCNGWVSSLALDKLLEDRHMSTRVPRAKRRELMRSLGYDHHPGLREGRVVNNISDASGKVGKPVIYAKRGSIQMGMRDVGEIIRHYLEAQVGAAQQPACSAFAAAQGA